jgi:hypothetical protein
VHKVNCTLTLPIIGMLLLCIVYQVTVTGGWGGMPHAYSEWEVKPSPAAQRIETNIKKISLSTRYFSDANILKTRVVE